MTQLAVSDESTRQRVTRVGATGAVAFLFYLALGDPTDPFDVVTGFTSAVVVAAILARVAFDSVPSRGTLRAGLRAIVFLPILLTAVVRSNLALAAVVLDPELPIDPDVVRIPAPDGAVARALLANSITLTPGTLTLDLLEDELVVHTLTAASRAELLEGSLVRWVAMVSGERARTGRVEAGDD